jgi:hypothetical protein
LEAEDSESFFAKAYPMEEKSLAGAALCQFIPYFGVLEQLTFDGSGEQKWPKTEFMKHVRNHAIDYHRLLSLTEYSRTKHKRNMGG